jgi:type II secretory pathway component PulF
MLSLFPYVRAVSPLGGFFADRIIWWTPVLGGLVSDRGMADLCDIVGAGVGAGHPLDESLREAAGAQPNSVMRRRAAAWAAAVNGGQSMHEAARNARMPELFAAMLATVRGDDSLRQVLAFLWRHYEYRFSRARAILQAAYVPAIVFFFGSLVALIGVALMQPMAALIRVIGGN